MKKTILLSFTISALFFCSCKQKLSLSDKLFIEDQIALHNATFGLQHDLDSSQRRTELLKSLVNSGKSEIEANKYIDSVNQTIYKNDKSIRYNPQMDPHLTFEKFMDYCQHNKWQTPKEHAKLLTSKEKS